MGRDEYFNQWISTYDSAIAEGKEADEAADLADFASASFMVLGADDDREGTFWVELCPDEEGEPIDHQRSPLKFGFSDDGRDMWSVQKLVFVDLPMAIPHPWIIIWSHERGGARLSSIEVDVRPLREGESLTFELGTITMTINKVRQ